MDFKVETVAACRKKLSITISREEIDAKMNERFVELEDDAQVPGFRPGRAPRRLVEKRFHDAVLEEVRGKLVGEAFEKAIKDEKLDVIGDPFVDPDAIKMPPDGPMTFSIELEVRPEFTLPDYVGIPVNVARPGVADADVGQALERLRESHGRLEPVADGEAKENDLVTGDLTIQAGDVMLVDRQGVRLPVAAIALEGIRLETLPELLKGAKAGETRSAKITIGDGANREDVRGKEAELRVKIDSIERVVLPDEAALLKAVEYEDMESLRSSLKRQLTSQSENTFRRAQEEAIENWLLEQIPLALPEELSKRHADRLLQKQVVNLQYRGMPVEEIEKQAEAIRGSSTEQASRELKLTFILDAIAKKEAVEVTDAEVDARVRFIAAQYGQREDRLREKMAAEGRLDSLRGQILEDKVMRLLVEKAKIEGAEPPAAPPAEGAAPQGT